MSYFLSTDYKKLFAFICAGNRAAGFTRVDGFHNGDIVGITRRAPWNIHIGYRGMSFADVYPFNAEDGAGTEEEVFIKACKFAKLEWIDPTPPTALEKVEALLRTGVQLTTRQISYNTGLTYHTAARHLRDLHAAKAIHICGRDETPHRKSHKWCWAEVQNA